jgi:hypothetical protein
VGNSLVAIWVSRIHLISCHACRGFSAGQPTEILSLALSGGRNDQVSVGGRGGEARLAHLVEEVRESQTGTSGGASDLVIDSIDQGGRAGNTGVIGYCEGEVEVNRGIVRAETARPPTSVHRALTALRAATALRSADSTDATVSSSKGQVQTVALWRLGQPCPDHGVDLAGAGLWVLSAHPLPVKLDAQLVHVQGGLDPGGLRAGSPVCAAHSCPEPAKARSH